VLERNAVKLTEVPAHTVVSGPTLEAERLPVEGTTLMQLLFASAI